MRRLIILIFPLLMLPVMLEADDSYVFAPFISRLKAFEDNSSIKLTWKDSRDISGTCLIYRHTEEINRNNFSDSYLVAEVPSGTETFSDKVTDNTDFYYAVVVKNPAGEIFNIFLPYRNITLNPVSVRSINRLGDSAAQVKYLTVTVKQDSLLLNFDPSAEDRQLAVLRYIEPIFTSDDLLKSTILNIIPSYRKSYTDFPIPGVTYYYSVIDSELLKILKAELVPFENTTLNGSEIPIPTSSDTLQAISGSRSKPLPGFRLNYYLESGNVFSDILPDYIKASAKPSPEISELTGKLISGSGLKNYPENLGPEFLSDENDTNDNDSTRLSVILENYFSRGRWELAEEGLSGLYVSAAKKSIKSKCSFYLGQINYFRQQHNKSYLCFLESLENHYPESMRWMKNILEINAAADKN